MKCYVYGEVEHEEKFRQIVNGSGWLEYAGVATDDFSELDFDILVIAADRTFHNIVERLHKKYRLPLEKMCSITSLLDFSDIDVWGEEIISNYDGLQDFTPVLDKLKIKNVLDFGYGLARYGVISYEDPRYRNLRSRCRNKFCACGFECIFFGTPDMKVPFYEHIYHVKENFQQEKADALLCIDVFTQFPPELWSMQMENLLKLGKTVLFNLPNRSLQGGTYDEWNVEYFYNVLQNEEFSKKYKIQLFKGIYNDNILAVSKDYSYKSVGMYIAVHKKANFSHLNLGDEYKCILGGAINKVDHYGYLSDTAAEKSISELNPLINELTAVFYMLQEAEEDYIGLCHYRRFFLKDENAAEKLENILNREDILQYMEQDKYDVIVACPEVLMKYRGVYHHFFDTMDRNAAETGMLIITKLLEQRYPEYLREWQTLLNGTTFFPCNMFVMPKALFQEYFNWLFSFILDAVKMLPEELLKNVDDYSKRVIGFYAERLLTVWLMKKNLRIKELPFWLMELKDYELPPVKKEYFHIQLN